MDHERVAALHDGKLEATERDDLLAAIAADDEQSWLFAETAGVLADIEAARRASTPEPDRTRDEAGGDPPTLLTADPPIAPVAADDDDGDEGVIPLATRRPLETPGAAADAETAAREDGGVIPIESWRRTSARPWLVYGAMAAALAGIGIATALLRHSSDDGLHPGSAVAMLERRATPGLAEGWESPWPTTRGGNNSVDNQGVVRIGTRLFDLALAAQVSDTAAARRLGGQVVTLLENQNGGSLASPSFAKIAAGDRDVNGLLARGEADLRELVDGTWLDLGIWAEAARTAAVRQDAAFFRSPTGERVLARAETAPEADASSRNAIRTVRAALPAGGRVDWDALEESLRQLMRVAGAPNDGPIGGAP